MRKNVWQGQFQLDVETLEAEGEGCGIDYLDIQVHRLCGCSHQRSS